MHRAALVGPHAPRAARPRPPLALDRHENQVLLDTLNSERFADTAPAAVHATLLDEGRYLGSVRTMYRLLASHGSCRERRLQLTHPAYTKPELLAVAPNQVWSWDITKLKGPAKWTCLHLYVILDIFSRHVVGWLVAERESAELAEQLIAQTVARQDVERGMLTLHADRGASMRSKPVAALLVDLDIAKSHSRPHVSDDNPYSQVAVQDDEVPARLPGALRLHRRCTRALPGVLRLVQHEAPALGHRLHDAAQRALRSCPGNARCTTRRARCRVPGPAHALQGPSPSTRSAAHRSVDQPATIGDRHRKHNSHQHSKFMTPGAAMSLTRSGR
jgi:transposase InsO family protein